MSKEKRSVPKLRFPGFTEDWEQCKLTSFTQRVKGNDGRMDLPTLTISASEGWLNQKDRFSANIAGSEQKNYTLLRQGELSYNHGNSKLAKYGVVYVLKDYKEALVPRVYHSFKVDESYDALFVEYYFSTKRPDRELAKLVSSGARMDGLLNIGYDEFTNISISVPTFSEQRQIVALLRRFDKFITLHQRKLEHLILKKKSLLQKLFPKNGERYPELRFPGFTDAWEQRKLDSLGKIITGNTPSTLKKEYWSPNSDGVVWITPTDINSVKTQCSERLLTKEGASQARIVPANSILVTCIASIGKNTINTVEAAFNQQINALVPHFSNSYFILTMLNNMESAFKRVAGTSATSIINKKEFGQLSALLPEIEEQNKIGRIFELIDDNITLHQRKLEHLQLQKKALLQQMFV